MLEQTLFMSMAHRIRGHTNAALHRDYTRGYRLVRDQGEDCTDHTNSYRCDEGPEKFVRVVFLSYPKGSGFTGGSEAPTAALNCVLRSGHTVEEKTDMLKQFWGMCQDLTGIATDQLTLALQEIAFRSRSSVNRFV